MTKKEFKERCSFHVYGKGRNKRNAIYFDYMPPNGFRYMVKARVENCTKSELFDVLYNWAMNEVIPSWWVEYRYAESDDKRFKVSLMG